MKALLALAFALLIATGAPAEMEKTATVGGVGFHTYIWPKLKIPAGWKRDEAKSHEIGANVLVPEGKTFDSADCVMYARATPAPKGKALAGLGKFIRDDVADFRKDNPKGTAVELYRQTRTKGLGGLRTYQFRYDGRDRACFGAEGKYFVLFVLNAKDDAALKANLPTFEAMLADYR